jgi:hypothetical protein
MNMLTQDKRGVYCDRCGMQVIEKFTYYSFDAKEVVVTNNSMSFTQGSTPTHSFDICSRCMEEIKAIIIRCYKPSRIIDNRSCPNGIFCDLTGTIMRGNFTCFYICVSVVVVNINNNPSVQITDEKYVELWICSDAFAQLKNKAIEIQNKENKEWSSQAIQTK